MSTTTELEEELYYALINLRYGVGQTKHWCNADERYSDDPHSWECKNAIRAVHKARPYEYAGKLWEKVLNEKTERIKEVLTTVIAPDSNDREKACMAELLERSAKYMKLHMENDLPEACAHDWLADFERFQKR